MHTLVIPSVMALVAALLKWCVQSYFNATAFVVTGCVLMIAGSIFVKAQHQLDNFVSVLALAGVVSVEIFLYDVPILGQFAVTLGLFVYLYRELQDTYQKFLFAWLVFRVIMMVATQDLSHIVLWRLAQAALFVAVISQKTFRVVISVSVYVIVFVIYSQKDVIPHQIPILLMALPLMYVALRAIEDVTFPQAVQTLVVVLIVVCAIYPHHDLQEIHTNACSSILNTELCSDMPFQTPITDKCCCKTGFAKMPRQTACVRETCVSNLNRDPQKDCCKINRNPETEPFLAGEYMCLCNNQPGQEVQNEFDAVSQSCVCNNGLSGNLCTLTDTIN